MRYASINPKLFIVNRQALRAGIAPGQAIIMKSNATPVRTGDTSYPFRQDSNFFWATGIDQPDSALILTRSKEYLFIRETNEYEKVWMGARLESDQAISISGIKTVYPLAKLDQFKHELKAKTPRPALWKALRSVKSPIEVELLQRSIEITKAGFSAALLQLKPGVKEYQLEAELTHQYILQGASGPAYETIVAGGANACYLHYTKNNQALKDGQLVLIDAGAEYANYAADVTRVWPVGGRFSQRQRQIYQAVWRIQTEAIKLLAPGVFLKEYEKKVGEIMTEELVRLRLLGENAPELVSNGNRTPAYREFYMHGTSHFLGLDVHDAGDYYQPLAAGMVVTCEPGIYIKEEGIGIRLEDDILITKKGSTNLSASIPIDPDEIESLLAKRKAYSV